MNSLFESVQLGSLALSKSRLHGAAYAQPRRRGWRPRRTRGDLLRATSISRTHHHRGDPDFPDGEGIHQHSRHSFSSNRFERGAASSMPFMQKAGEYSFSCGMSAESLIRPCCQTTRNPLLHPQSVPIARR